METSESIQKFVELRQRYFQRFDEIRIAVDAWLEDHADELPSMGDMAQLQGLHDERTRLHQEYQAAEDAFINELLTLRPERSSNSGS